MQSSKPEALLFGCVATFPNGQIHGIGSASLQEAAVWLSVQDSIARRMLPGEVLHNSTRGCLQMTGKIQGKNSRISRYLPFSAKIHGD